MILKLTKRNDINKIWAILPLKETFQFSVRKIELDSNDGNITKRLVVKSRKQ